jgi:HK97 family phage major capsid protein
LWGVPVVQSFFQPQGTAWLANWRKAVLWDREAATISVSDSHSDFFIRNMVAILAEMRAAFGIIRPSAFVEVDLAAGS